MAQLKSMISALFTWNHGDTSSKASAQSARDFHTKFKKAFKSGKFEELIAKAEVDYENGKALDTLY